MKDGEPQDDPAPFKRQGEAYLLPGRIEAIEQEQAEAKRRDERYKEQQISLEGRLVRYTFWLFVLGVLGTGVTVWQSVIAQRAADAAMSAADTARVVMQKGEAAAKEQAIAQKNQQRARLSLSFYLTAEPKANTDYQPRIRVNISGYTPAFNARSRSIVRLQPSPPPMPEWSTLDNTTNDGILISPGDTGRGFMTQGHRLTQADQALYYARKSHIYVWTRVTYCDAFGRLHWVQACEFHRHGVGEDLFSMCPIAGANTTDQNDGDATNPECRQ